MCKSQVENDPFIGKKTRNCRTIGQNEQTTVHLTPATSICRIQLGLKAFHRSRKRGNLRMAKSQKQPFHNKRLQEDYSRIAHFALLNLGLRLKWPLGTAQWFLVANLLHRCLGIHSNIRRNKPELKTHANRHNHSHWWRRWTISDYHRIEKFRLQESKFYLQIWPHMSNRRKDFCARRGLH